MATHFTADFFIKNRARLRGVIDSDGPIVIPANALLQRGGDASFGFQQDASFWYLSGINEPEILLVMDEGEEYLIVPPREVVREAFDGTIDHSGISKLSGIKQIYEKEAGWEKLAASLRKTKQFAVPEPNPAYIEFYGMYTNPARASLLEKIRSIAGDSELLDIRKDIAQLRMVKQPPEIAALQRAVDITAAAITEATSSGKLASYHYEYELEAAIGFGFRNRGAKGHGFDPIVAGGKNAVTLHYLANNDRLSKDALVVVDVGAEYQQYCADISRTFSVGGSPTKRQQAVFTAVCEVQDYAYSLLKPGVLMREYEKQIETYLGEKLLELQLITTNDRDSVRKFYPHACSHFLGIDPHDAGDYEQALEPGVVLTVEPGIYIPEEGIGVRIEDDVVVTQSGITVMSKKLPKQLTA